MEEINLNKKCYLPAVNAMRGFKDRVAEVPDELIYYKYLGPTFKVGGVVISPFRKDKNPSLGVFYDENGVLVFNDFGDSDYAGVAFDFVWKYYREILEIISPQDMLRRFIKDFKDTNHLVYMKPLDLNKSNLRYARYKSNSEFVLEVKIRDFNTKDLAYWISFGISIKTLKLFNVFPISHYFINGKGFLADKFAYVYVEKKDDDITFKIYQPYNKKMKWIANINFSIHQGYRILPEKGNLLIITKALKDVMSLYDTKGISSIGVQGEKARIKLDVIKEYKQRFTHVLSLFDNDKEGINLSEYFKLHYDIEPILIPKILKSKDYSDLVKNYNKERAGNIITTFINSKINGKTTSKKT